MKQVLEPLAKMPGVRTAALVTPDGVPIAVHHAPRPVPKAAKGSHRDPHKDAHKDPHAEAKGHKPKPDHEEAPEREESWIGGFDPSSDLDALAGLATGWMGEITRAVAPLSWDAPQQLVLRAARGTLIIVQAPGALLLVVLEGGMRSEELRLPMEVAVARMQRHLRGASTKNASASATGDQPAGIFPARTYSSSASDAEGIGADAVHSTGPGVPEVSGE